MLPNGVLGRLFHPWRLADWVEEVKDISRQIEASFIHIHREANDLMDGLAREGVFHSSIYFDV